MYSPSLPVNAGLQLRFPISFRLEYAADLFCYSQELQISPSALYELYTYGQPSLTAKTWYRDARCMQRL